MGATAGWAIHVPVHRVPNSCPPGHGAMLLTSYLCPPLSGAGHSFQIHLTLWSPFCLLEKLNWSPSALTVIKAQLMIRAVWSTALLSVSCCPTAGSISSPSGAMVAAFLSINKSKRGRAVEKQELCRVVKGDKAKANGLKQERKTIQDEKIRTARCAKKHPREPLHWWFLLWEDQGAKGEEAVACYNTLWLEVQKINIPAPGILITTEKLRVAQLWVRQTLPRSLP